MLDNKKAKEVLHSLKREVEEFLDNNLVDMFLFGSYARGDFTPESDLDVLIVVNRSLTREEKNKISHIISTLSLESDIVIACVVYEKDFFDNVRSPLMLCVKEEGIKV